MSKGRNSNLIRSSSFCNRQPDIDWLGELNEIRKVLIDIASYTFDSGTGAIDQIARWRRAMIKLERFQARITEASLQAVICQVLQHVNFEEELLYVERAMSEMTKLLEDLDAKISVVRGTFEEIEEEVNKLMAPFERVQEVLLKKVENKLNEMFRVLISIGATEQEIRKAIDGATLSLDPRIYITEVYVSILDQVLFRLYGDS